MDATDDRLTQVPVGKAEMLIRRPVAQVFDAFIEPEITTKFWFTKSSGRLGPGKQLQWDWEMYGSSIRVHAEVVELNKRIVVTWGDPPTRVEWVFTPRGENATFVSVTDSGFDGNADEVVSKAMGSTAGFTMVLCGLKAYLEHGIVLNLVADRFPDALVPDWKTSYEVEAGRNVRF